MSDLSDYEQKLLQGWEEAYKKGQLTLWIMLALKESPKHMSQIKKFITKATGGSLSADDKSLYRALRRYHNSELVKFTSQPGQGGPDRKVYSLTKIGQNVLQAFLERNIAAVFYDPAIVSLINEEGHDPPPGLTISDLV